MFYKAKNAKKAQGKLKRLAVCVPLWDLLREGLEAGPASSDSFQKLPSSIPLPQVTREPSCVLPSIIPDSFDVTTCLGESWLHVGSDEEDHVLERSCRTPHCMLTWSEWVGAMATLLPLQRAGFAET